MADLRPHLAQRRVAPGQADEGAGPLPGARRDARARGQRVPHGAFEGLGRGQFGRRLAHRAHPALGAQGVERRDGLLLGREVAVEGARGDPGGPGDVLGPGGPQALAGEEAGRRAGDLHPGLGLAPLGQGGRSVGGTCGNGGAHVGRLCRCGRICHSAGHPGVQVRGAPPLSHRPTGPSHGPAARPRGRSRAAAPRGERRRAARLGKSRRRGECVGTWSVVPRRGAGGAVPSGAREPDERARPSLSRPRPVEAALYGHVCAGFSTRRTPHPPRHAPRVTPPPRSRCRGPASSAPAARASRSGGCAHA